MNGDESERLEEAVVDRSGIYFELCFGSGDDSPATWRVVLRFAAGAEESDCFVKYEPSKAADEDKLEIALRLVASRLCDPDASVVYRHLPGGAMVVDVTATMNRIVGSTSNWYGDWHFRRGPRTD